MKEETGYERFETLPSTNDYALKKRGEGKNLIVVAKRQTGGRGTKGRSFVSEEGGVYLSKLTFYKDFPVKRAFEIMQGAAAAVCETLESYGLVPKIKWPNDVYVNGKKICGILIENAFSGGNIASSVVGIGLNVCNTLPAELSEIATSIGAETGKTESAPSAEEVEKRLLFSLCKKDIHKKYGRYLGWIGEKVVLIAGEEKLAAKILSVEADGGLLAETETGVRKFASAEVSLRAIGEERQ